MGMKIDIDDLAKVQGIGAKTIERIKEQLREKKKDDYKGEKFSFELNQFYCEESVEWMQKHLPDDYVDLTITSPPYDNLRLYNGYVFDYEKILRELYRVTKDGGVVVWVVNDATINGDETGTSFKHALCAKDIGFKLHDTMIYEKNTSSFPANKNSNRYTQIFEYMFVFSKGNIRNANLICDKKNKWAGSKNWGSNTDRHKDGELRVKKDIKSVPDYSPRNNIWRYVVGGGFGQTDKIAYNHPATFPEKLAEDHILSWSNEGDVVLDPMCGSGTVAKMSYLNNRKFIGVDMSEEYIENICKPRLKEVMNND